MRDIVLGWINRDIGSSTYGQARAATWLLNGKVSDLREARRYAAQRGYRVFVFRAGDPRDILMIVRDACRRRG